MSNTFVDKNQLSGRVTPSSACYWHPLVCHRPEALSYCNYNLVDFILILSMLMMRRTKLAGPAQPWWCHRGASRCTLEIGTALQITVSWVYKMNEIHIALLIIQFSCMQDAHWKWMLHWILFPFLFIQDTHSGTLCYWNYSFVLVIWNLHS